MLICEPHYHQNQTHSQYSCHLHLQTSPQFIFTCGTANCSPQYCLECYTPKNQYDLAMWILQKNCAVFTRSAIGHHSQRNTFCIPKHVSCLLWTFAECTNNQLLTVHINCSSKCTLPIQNIPMTHDTRSPLNWNTKNCTQLPQRNAPTLTLKTTEWQRTG